MHDAKTIFTYVHNITEANMEILCSEDVIYVFFINYGLHM